MRLVWLLWLIGLICLILAFYNDYKHSPTTQYWYGLATAFFLSNIIVGLIYQ